MLFASIDIGTNAVRLFFANVYENKNIPVSEKASLIRIPLRLGEDVFQSGKISEEREEKLINTMKAFKILMNVYTPLEYIACATSAIREASNGKKIVERISQETGIDIKIISGLEEAGIICESNNLIIDNHFKKTMYIDVGGGSTEISILHNHKLIDSNSFKIGTIRMLREKVEKSEWIKMKDWLQNFRHDFGILYCIGSGGNINKLAKLYSSQKDNALSYANLQDALEHLNSFTLQERIEVMGLRPDRADVIIPATEIFLTIMKTTKSRFINVPKIGLTDGLIYTAYRDYIKQKKLS